MRSPASKRLALVATVAAMLIMAAPALAALHFDGSLKVSAAGANSLKMANSSDGNIWMTLEGSAKDAAEVSSAGVVTEYELEGSPPGFPDTILGPTRKAPIRITGRIAKVKFTFTSPSPEARFECSLATEIRRKGKRSRLAGRAFHNCESPKIYRLKPGYYRFEVRAVVGALVDPRPSRFGFKVVHIFK